MTPIRYQDHSDGVREKLRLLEAAYAAGNLDLAMSLAEAAKDSLVFERQQTNRAAQDGFGADRRVVVDDLPKPWGAWARGWKFCKPVSVFETVGIKRAGEPVELAIAFPADETSDLGRELRVAHVNPDSGALAEIPCQVDDETRRGHERHCRLLFAADVPAHRQATYLVFYGNPWAERPAYATDLCVRGEGYGLDIENRHFTARLSRQMGQLERLTYKRQHGLELYAGGKGHGEPPGIDWAHDYVDEGHFQKLRMRNWPECPNYEVIHGPLCARVRRWGFPYSPVHPVFTPARVHMDQAYAFYAGLPYFFKQGRIDVVKDVHIAAMRDDEWVFSGYSFTDMVWFDRQGKLHEGSVPAESAKNLWGVGFYNRTSRDAFIALWLEHEAKGFDPAHSGPPTLHYDGHGQLWSRYPAEKARLKAGTMFRQRNAYLVAPFDGPNAEGQVERLRHQLLNPLEIRAGEVPRTAAAGTGAALARPGETRETAPLKQAIWKALAEVRDEQLYKIDSNIVDLGYVYDVRARDGVVSILVTMPHRGRPVYEFLVNAGGGRVEPGIRERVLAIPGVRDVVVEFTWNPPWTADRLSDAARRAFGLPA
jgi:metal-sulfur cluster biosynthetic enzyme